MNIISIEVTDKKTIKTEIDMDKLKTFLDKVKSLGIKENYIDKINTPTVYSLYKVSAEQKPSGTEYIITSPSGTEVGRRMSYEEAVKVAHEASKQFGK